MLLENVPPVNGEITVGEDESVGITCVSENGRPPAEMSLLIESGMG